MVQILLVRLRKFLDRSTYLNHQIFKHVATLQRRKMTTNGKPTAGIIIIGDEIIKGQVQDTNSRFLCDRLFRLGVFVERISVIRDHVETIADEVKHFSKTFDYVLTSGGIGPTHDDLTFEGVAKAFGEELSQHPILTELVKKFIPNTQNGSPTLRLALVPTSAKLNFVVNQEKGTKNTYPLVSVKNVYIFPGVPHLLERIFDHLGEELFGKNMVRPHFKELFIAEPENKITPVLNEAVQKFKGRVTFGSYPEMQHSYYKLRITMETSNEKDSLEAEAFFRSKLEGSLVEFVRNPVEKVVENVYSMCNSDSVCASELRESIKFLEKCFRNYTLDQVCISFNGGKDCTLLLHLVYAVLKKNNPSLSNPSLKTIYVREVHPFPQLESFVQETAVRYNLDLITLNPPMKQSLTQLKENDAKLSVAIMGSRRTDPYCEKLDAFQQTDPDWPPFLRVSPILDWSYSQVWKFIRTLQLPYCSLYDKGYTSIGNMDNTMPNPSLQFIDTRGMLQYKAAYELTDESEERKGRK